jgi:hypothetical protein
VQYRHLGTRQADRLVVRPLTLPRKAVTLTTNRTKLALLTAGAALAGFIVLVVLLDRVYPPRRREAPPPRAPATA